MLFIAIRSRTFHERKAALMPYKDPEKAREAKRKWEQENRGRGKRHRVWMFIFYAVSYTHLTLPTKA